MMRVFIAVLAMAMMIVMAPGDAWAGLKTRPYEDVRRAEASASAGRAQETDTVTAARALVPLLNGVRQRLRPGVGVVRGTPPDSPFTGTQTTIFSIGIGKKEQPIDPRVVAAMNRLTNWKIRPADQSPEAVLFSHWLTQLTTQALGIGIADCDATCVVARFTKPDEKFGRSRFERNAVRDQLLLDALTDAVEELEPPK